MDPPRTSATQWSKNNPGLRPGSGQLATASWANLNFVTTIVSLKPPRPAISPN